MRYYLDTEFNEDGRTIDLISIALVAEDGREFYAISTDAELHRVNPWVREHVLPHLPPYGDPRWMSRPAIRAALCNFVGFSEKPSFWAYYADYDWIAVCQLFGTMLNLPKGWPMLCLDLKQLALSMGDPPLPKQPEGAEHDALADARWNRDAHAFLLSIGSSLPSVRK